VASSGNALGRIAAYAVYSLWCRRLGPWYNTRSRTICRFHPSCSKYAVTAYLKYGLVRGSILTICRIRRCNPANTNPCTDFP
jgi:uncharacterized protein